MKSYIPLCSLMALLCLPLVACDQPDAQTSGAATSEENTAAVIAPSAADETLPTTTTPEANVESVAAESSMAEDSPAGEGVTAEEIPHSDVPPPSREVFADAECSFEDWVGKPVDEAAVKETGRPYRILTPDSMMTMDHNPERINLVHDADGKVTRVWCG